MEIMLSVHLDALVNRYKVSKWNLIKKIRMRRKGLVYPHPLVETSSLCRDTLDNSMLGQSQATQKSCDEVPTFCGNRCCLERLHEMQEVWSKTALDFETSIDECLINHTIQELL